MKIKQLLSDLSNFHRNQEGVTSVEYAVMLALIAAVCVATINLVGGEAGIFWSNNSQEISNAIGQ